MNTGKAYDLKMAAAKKKGMYDLKSILFMPVMGHQLNSVFNLSILSCFVVKLD